MRRRRINHSPAPSTLHEEKPNTRANNPDNHGAAGGLSTVTTLPASSEHCAAGVAVGIAAAGGVAIYAASSSTNTDQGGGHGGGDGGPLMMFEIPHGEFQTGELTDISITLESEDDFSRTYVIDDETAQTDGIEEVDTATATSISELSTRQGGGPNPPESPN